MTHEDLVAKVEQLEARLDVWQDGFVELSELCARMTEEVATVLESHKQAIQEATGHKFN